MYEFVLYFPLAVLDATGARLILDETMCERDYLKFLYLHNPH
jgi:hypothetical protein